MSGKYASQFLEIFWEAAEQFIDERKHLATSSLPATFPSDRSAMYVSVIHSKLNALKNCAGFVDETATAIARPGDYRVQKAAHNGQSKKHAVKHQAAANQGRLVLHCTGPAEGTVHDWILYFRSGFEGQLQEKLSRDSAHTASTETQGTRLGRSWKCRYKLTS